MIHICPHCRKVCKSANGLQGHITARHAGGVKPSGKPREPRQTSMLPPRHWIEPALRTPVPALSEQIASLEMAYRFYELRQGEAVEERNVTPHTAYHNCSNVLHALESLRWLRKNEAAIKRLLAERKAA